MLAGILTNIPDNATISVRFPFTSDSQLFAANPGTGVNSVWQGSGGNPSGCLSSSLSNLLTTSTSTWTRTLTYEDMGVPAGATVTSISGGTLDSKCTAYFLPGLGQNSSGSATLVDGATNVTLSAVRNFSAVDSSYVTTSGTGVFGLYKNSSNSVTLTISNTLSTLLLILSNVTLLQDNLNFILSYVEDDAQFKVSGPLMIERIYISVSTPYWVLKRTN